MSLTIPSAVLDHVTSNDLVARAEQAKAWRNREVDMYDQDLTDAALADLIAASNLAGDRSFSRIVSSIQAARSGDFSKSIPNFKAAVGVITSFLRRDLIDGWVYRNESDGHLHAYLVTDVRIEAARNPDDPDRLEIHLLANNGDSKLGSYRTSVSLSPEDVTRKKVEDILLGARLYTETPELKAAYLAVQEDYRVILTGGFAEQYRFTGTPTKTGSWRNEGTRENRKVIHDIDTTEIPAFAEWAPSVLADADDDDDETPAASTRQRKARRDGRGSGPVPIRPVLRVFDLRVHDFIWVNTQDLTRYVYDLSLRDKIVLPDDQRDLLDILTTDISTFTADIIEGKSAGNVILCKGTPGLGKTLSAEVYSELIERPLYSIHSGNLGTTADSIRKNLEEAFTRAKRWNAVLLLDEADVFVISRGTNLNQNAIVAEFLRTLEYFTGLLFMTTNRADDIDEAIVSRTAAIIDYKTPDAAGLRKVWQVQAANNDRILSDDLLDALVGGFPQISPRDVKMLLRLSLRVAAHHGEDLSVATFRQCAMFRGLHFQD